MTFPPPKRLKLDAYPGGASSPSSSLAAPSTSPHDHPGDASVKVVHFDRYDCRPLEG
ncbi:uncharacterized protein EHS24_002296 [Apiotrichum porosum]|uniref:Uncharacterized protein n=1 Tax=Apiotrichum porosum TaxID=105984 RepID=A0A427XI40_9TREE|nr:uncharacterized protein EHS24_002296 [Apiotrichum porosum]RSH78569.1 hypothetical protein EHS24_002296 [Apiotrichum porosum]